jgi:hypothetical protein
VNLLAQPPLGSDAEAVADQQHPDQQLRVDRGTTRRAVKRSQIPPHLRQVDEPVDRPQQVILRHMPLDRKLVEQRRLVDLPLAHHRRRPPPA